MSSALLRQGLSFLGVADGLNDALVCINEDFIIAYCNPATQSFLGQNPDKLVGKPFAGILSGDDKAEILDCLKKCFIERTAAVVEARLITAHETFLPASLSIAPCHEDAGKLNMVSLVLRPVQERHQLLAAIIEGSDDAIVSKTLEGVITSWNRAAESIFGYKTVEAIGQHISILIPEDRLSEEDMIIESIKRGDKVAHYQTIRKRKDGKLLHISLTVSPIRNGDGIVIGASKIARDVTRQREAEVELEKKSQRLIQLNAIAKTINERLDIGVILQKLTDTTTNLTGASFGVFYQNKSPLLSEILSYSGTRLPESERLKEVLNTEALKPVLTSTVPLLIEDVVSDVRYDVLQNTFNTQSGNDNIRSFLYVPVNSGSGKNIGGLFFGHHKTNMFLQEHLELVENIAVQAAVALDNSRLLQEVVELSNRKDEFIALTSHELRTPLASLSGYLQILLLSITDEVNKPFLDKAEKQLAKLTRLVSDLFDVSRIQNGKMQFYMEQVSVSDLVADVADTFNHTHPEYIINYNIPEDFIIQADKIRLVQVLVNLIANAIKYAPDSNQIDVGFIRQDAHLLISVRDYGAGINTLLQQEIFSRFYRVEKSKNNSVGLGLGLYISKEIVTSHKGTIWVDSTNTPGATFFIKLPLA